MIATLGFHDLATVRVLVALDFARLALSAARRACGTHAHAFGRVQNGDHLAQAHAVLFQQHLELLFKLDLLLQAGIVFHRIQLLKLSGQLGFQCFEFGKFGHEKSFLSMRHVKAY
ncbi:hypothetical protein D3C77_232290 [compost metagenome]